MTIPSDSISLTGYLLPAPQQTCDTATWSVIGNVPDSIRLDISPISTASPATEESEMPSGDIGEPMPYQLAEDNVAVGLWLIGFIILTATFLRLRSLIRAGWWQAVKASDAEVPSLALHWWDYALAFLSCSVMLTFAAYAATGFGADTSTLVIPTWLIVTAIVGILFLVFILRLGVQSWVNYVFWKPDTVSQWRATFLLATATASALLFFTGMAAVYIPLSVPYVPYMLIAVYGIFKIFLLFSEISIFSSAKTAFSHIILYICTLEILPLFFLWKGVEFILSL